MSCSADDLATALGSAVIRLRALVLVLLEMGAVTGLIFHAGKSMVLNFSARGHFGLWHSLADMPMASSFDVTHSGV